MTLREAILETRRGVGDTQVAFAERLKVSVQSILKWEAADVEPGTKNLEKVLKVARNAKLDEPARVLEMALSYARGHLLADTVGVLAEYLRDGANGIFDAMKRPEPERSKRLAKLQEKLEEGAAHADRVYQWAVEMRG